MKLRRYFLSFFCFIFCLTHSGSSQVLKPGVGPKLSFNGKHLAFESNKGDSILFYKGYTVVFSYRYNLPLYTFHVLTTEQLIADSIRVPVKRSNSFYPTFLPVGTLSATNIDYSKSGYDRGHMVPAGDFVWDKELKDETFFYTNINPQIPNLNRGIWAHLENQIRSRVLQLVQEAVVVTGVVFNPDCQERIGPNGLCVPVAFFKIVFFEKRNEMFAFLFDNTIDYYQGDLSDFQVTVDFLELITGEDFFDLLDDEREALIESKLIFFNDGHF